MPHTKNDPGCFQKAEEDEPLFTLLARDPVAPTVIRIWSDLREQFTDTNVHKLADAREVADEMEEWRRRRHL